MNFRSMPSAKVPVRTPMMVLAPFSVFLAALLSSSLFGRTIPVCPWENLAGMVSEYPAGTTFSIEPGIHRLNATIVPRNNDVFVGQTGAILSGAAQLTAFSKSGSVWVSRVQVTERSSYPGQCDSFHPACTFPEDLFFDSVPKLRVATPSAVGPGTWYLN